MTCIRQPSFWVAGLLGAAIGCGPSEPKRDAVTREGPVTSGAPSSLEALHHPAHLSRFDIITRDDLCYAYLLGPFATGEDVTDWPLLNEANKAFHRVLGDVLSAEAIVGLLNSSMSADGHKPLGKIDALVGDCARILCMPKPNVWVQNSSEPNLYVIGGGDSSTSHLVLTSRVLDLFEHTPEELRFLVGRELSHIKCNRVRLKAVSKILLKVIARINQSCFSKLEVLSPLAFGRYCSWCRESEISADRAGLLCCQNAQTAYDALARLLHGLNAGSKWLDPKDRHFDANRIISDFKRWEDRPFVDFVRFIKNESVTAPFIAERVAALKIWSESGMPERILARRQSAGRQLIVEIKHLYVGELCGVAESVDPYVKVFCRDERQWRFVTDAQKKVREALWENIDQGFECDEDEPIFVQIWDANAFPKKDTLIGAFMIQPMRGKRLYEASIYWDERGRDSFSRISNAKVQMIVSPRAG